MKLATTLADFRGYCDDSAAQVRCFEGTGFKHLDYSFWVLNYQGSPFMGDDWVKDIAAAAKEAEKLGFDFVQAHSPSNDYFRSDKEEVLKGNIRSIEACAYLGIKKLVVHSGRSTEFIAPDDKRKYLESVRDFYEKLYPYMEKYGVHVLAENYTPSSKNECSFFSGEDLKELLDFCDHPLLGVCWDVGHGNLQRSDQHDDIVALGKYLKAVHIQDNLGVNDNHLAPLMGTLNIDSVMRGLIDNGFTGNGGIFTFECDNIVRNQGEWLKRDKNKYPDYEVKHQSIRLLYEIGKMILNNYGLYEE